MSAWSGLGSSYALADAVTVCVSLVGVLNIYAIIGSVVHTIVIRVCPTKHYDLVGVHFRQQPGKCTLLQLTRVEPFGVSHIRVVLALGQNTANQTGKFVN